MTTQETTAPHQLIPLLDFLQAHKGAYGGHGTNFEGLPFKATLQIDSRIGGTLIELRFRAEDDESAFHDEATWISTDLAKNRVSLWTVSTNTPGVLEHPLVQDLSNEPGNELRARRLVFRLGDPSQEHTFRQEITLDIMHDRSVEYRYAWGVPHEKLATRTRTVLRPV